MRRRIIAVLMACVLCGAAQAADFTEERCYVDGFETPVRCVSIAVPLDYAAPQGETLEVTAAIVPAVTARPAGDPLFVLAGGPGQAATGLGPWLDSAFRPARRARDIVLFDIRGTGLSGALMCPFSLTGDADGPGQFRRDAAACAKIHGAKANFHSSREIVEDIERFRRALGYSKINLWGGSFGTRIAQHYVRRYGAHVRAVVLDAATPASESIFATAPLYGQQALDRLFADCAADAACTAAFPRLHPDFEALVRRAEATPIPYEASDPRDGRVRRVSVDRDGVVGLVRGALYAGITRGVVPYAITQGALGDMRALIALGAATSEWSAETMALGSMLSIVCAEDLARSLRGDQGKNAFGFMGDSYVRVFAAGCSVWPYREVPSEMAQALSSRVPALAISGEADPVTPPASGEATLRMFATRVHAIVPHGFHTNSSNRCVADIIGSFLADPERGGRDHACLKRAPRPRFLVSPTM